LVIEKPFGKDLKSANLLTAQLYSLFRQEQIYIIDHFLGKEMVQNIMALKFANVTLEPVWNRNYIASVFIDFKEDFGVEVLFKKVTILSF
jgi:glucose-6-phosphate 1-dehydrogenase